MAKRRSDIGRNLTPQQKRAAEMLVQNEWGELTDGKKLSQDQLAERLGIARSTLYEWRKNPEFVEYMNMLTDDLLNGMRAEVNAALMKLIRMPNPSVKAIELYMKRHALLTDRTVIENESEPPIPRKSDAEIAEEIRKLNDLINGEGD